MEVDRITLMITRLIVFWKSQKIPISTKTLEEIDIVVRERDLSLPSEFIELYSNVNGMGDFYPNEFDEEGFLFYPVESIVSVNSEFENCNLINKDSIFIFAEYMHKSWWYGFELVDGNEFVIGIIPNDSSFKPISNSLADFLELYIENSPKLYDYS